MAGYVIFVFDNLTSNQLLTIKLQMKNIFGLQILAPEKDNEITEINLYPQKMEIILYGLTEEKYNFSPYEEFNITEVGLDDSYLKNLCIKKGKLHKR